MPPWKEPDTGNIYMYVKFFFFNSFSQELAGNFRKDNLLNKIILP